MALTELVDVLETFGCDMKHKGMPDFILLHNLLVGDINRGVKGPRAGAILRDIAALRGKYFLALNSSMTAAIRPLLDADPAALEYFGIELRKRTVCGAAEALARLTLSYKNSGI